MIQPVRIEGARIPNGGELFGATRADGRKITYQSFDETETFVLHAPTVAESEVQRVVLKPDCTDGWSVEPDFSEQETVNGFGARTVGFKLPAFDAGLDFTVTSDVQDVLFEERDWRRAWSFFKPGRLKVQARDGGNRWCRAVLRSMADLSRELKGETYYEGSLSWRNPDGCWFGESQRFTGVGRVVVGGDVRPSCRVVWDTESNPTASVVFPSGQQLTLTAGEGVTGVRYINLDRGMVGHCTREDGTVDDVLWASLRGRVLGVALEPHARSTWQLNGVELEVTPRYLTPWG